MKLVLSLFMLLNINFVFAFEDGIFNTFEEKSVNKLNFLYPKGARKFVCQPVDDNLHVFGVTTKKSSFFYQVTKFVKGDDLYDSAWEVLNTKDKYKLKSNNLINRYVNLLLPTMLEFEAIDKMADIIYLKGINKNSKSDKFTLILRFEKYAIFIHEIKYLDKKLEKTDTCFLYSENESIARLGKFLMKEIVKIKH